MTGQEFAIIITMLGIGGTLSLAGMIIRAVNRHLDRKHAKLGGGATAPEVERLTGAVRELQEQIVQLEERVDFTERLLAQARESERLGP